MNSYGAVYARVPGGGVPELETAIKEARAVSKHSSPLGVLAFDPAIHSFAVVDRWGRSDNLPIWAEGPDLSLAFELAVLSKSVGDVIAFYAIDEGLEMGIFGAWKDGRLVRDLQWMDYKWSRVEGEPQLWEAPLFSEENLQKSLERADSPESVREAFAKNRFIPDSQWPDPPGLITAIRTVYPGPLMGFSPWPPRKELVEKNRAQDKRKQ